MAKILYRGVECELESGETVLDCLLRHGIDCVYSCRTGKCHACMMRCKTGDVPPNSQTNLKATWKQRGYFMPCVSRLADDQSLELQTLDEAERTAARVLSIEPISSAVARVRLQPEDEFLYEPGQFITLLRDDTIGRSYSLASIPGEEFIELHVRRWPGGAMSSWIHDELKPGERLFMRGPYGECFYVPGQLERPLLLIGTGTGAAPLWGIARHALEQGHTGPIVFMHKGHDEDGLYLQQQLVALANQHETVSYVACVTMDTGERGVQFGSIIEMARNRLLEFPNPQQVSAYVCGNPDIVKMLRKELFLAGMSMRDIFFDAFVFNTIQKRRKDKSADKLAAVS